MTKVTKPVRRTMRLDVAHGITPDIIVSLYPSGVIGLRESGRRQEHYFGLAQLLERAIIEEAACARRSGRKARA
jgi:hypothetical protein